MGASALARITPKSWESAVDQARHDLVALVDGLSGRREPSYSDRTTAPARPAPLSSIDPIEHALPRRLRLYWVTMRNDVAWLVRDLRGEPRPIVVERPPRPRTTSLSTRVFRVERVIRETDDAFSIVLAAADGSPITYEAGQFLTFYLSIDGTLVKRAYSLSTSPLDGTAAVTVKRMENGRASAWLHANLREGASLAALGPSGTFAAPRAREPARLVMIAGGSGITPIMSILETVLRARPELSVGLVYGNRSERDIIFFERLDRLRREHAGRLTIDHVLSDPSEGWTGPRGLLDRATLESRLERGDYYYLCGPSAMMDGARELLSSRGVPRDRVREERFHSPSDGAKAADLPDHPVLAEMRVEGRTHLVNVRPGQTLLEAGLAAGAPLPFSCAMGGCGACKVVLRAGEVHMEESCLNERERAEGYVLACSARPRSSCSIEVRR